MLKSLMFILLLISLFSSPTYSQKRYGYAVLYLRCGNTDPQRNRVYFSPVIELNTLNFTRYTVGMDPAFSKYSVRYYNYAIARWFEIFMKEKHKIEMNDPQKYERNATCVVFDNSKGYCNDDKTSIDCFYTDQKKLILHKNNAISECKLFAHSNDICEVISL
ncbi:MAG: hypothetical protein H7Z13_08930 [Ferruginibacter sp.]|nr:hypothetical protein [Ferruginibacter sp.]